MIEDIIILIAWEKMDINIVLIIFLKLIIEFIQINIREWLYFDTGLRSNVKEDINVILKLDPIDCTYFEGITTIQDGGRFTYW